MEEKIVTSCNRLPIKKNTMTSHIFIQLLKNLKLPLPIQEYKFHPKRKWRMDYAWLEQKIALEVEGGVWSQGRHTRGSGFIKDMEKYNEAAVMGFRIIRCVPADLCKQKTINLIQLILLF